MSWLIQRKGEGYAGPLLKPITVTAESKVPLQTTGSQAIKNSALVNVKYHNKDKLHPL